VDHAHRGLITPKLRGLADRETPGSIGWEPYKAGGVDGYQVNPPKSRRPKWFFA